jgi:hypothetical protein
MDGWPDARRVLYMIGEPAAHRFRIMPGADRMPVLIDQQIVATDTLALAGR